MEDMLDLGTNECPRPVTNSGNNFLLVDSLESEKIRGENFEMGSRDAHLPTI